MRFSAVRKPPPSISAAEAPKHKPGERCGRRQLRARFQPRSHAVGPAISGTSGNPLRFRKEGQPKEEAYMPVLLLWAVPAVIVVGGVGYYLVRAVH